MNNFITNKKELPQNVWIYSAIMPLIGISMIITSKDPKWVSILITLILMYAGGEAFANTYTTFTFESGRFIVGLPYRKYSLLWITANRTLIIEDALWDEVQIAYVYDKRKKKIYRRTFYFMKEGKYAYSFSAIGCEEAEDELRIRYPNKYIHIIEKDHKYRVLRVFTENNPDKVI